MCGQFIPFHLGGPAQRHRERTKTSQFGADDGRIGSHAIRKGACRDPSADGCPTEAYRDRTKKSQFAADGGHIGSNPNPSRAIPDATAAGSATEASSSAPEEGSIW